jgi:serine protease Do
MMFLINHKIKLCLSCLVLGMTTTVFCEVVTLQDGKQLVGELIKKEVQYIIVDMGFDLIKVPQQFILSIKENKSQKKVTTSSKKNQLYTAKKLHSKSIIDAVKQFSSSVVVIKRESGGMGSGFFVNDQGYIITNFHVIKNERHFTVIQLVKTQHESKRVIYKKIRIVAVDPLHDLAVLKIDEPLKEPITPIVFTPDATSLTSGNTVVAIGHPLGLEQTVTEGILSNPSRMFGGLMYLQMDAPINPGNSGGPLFNRYGEVIGVNNMGITQFQGLNFAIPVRNVIFLLDNLDAYAFNDANPETGYIYSAPPRKSKTKKTGINYENVEID